MALEARSPKQNSLQETSSLRRRVIQLNLPRPAQRVNRHGFAIQVTAHYIHGVLELGFTETAIVLVPTSSSLTLDSK